jgi:transposase
MLSTRSAAGSKKPTLGITATVTTRCSDPAAAAPRHEHHTKRSWARMLAGLEAGDDNQQISRAWIAAQKLRLLHREPDRVHAERRLLAWFTDIADHEIPELRLARNTLDTWREELLAYFDTGGVSNGPTEAIKG